MSATRQTYSRSDNISLFSQSIKELNRLCKEFNAKERSNKFIVRVKMMEMLAQQAFKYSISVSYLKDSEYHSTADILDNIYLRLSRSNVRNMANQYGSLATRDYDEMCVELGLIDERLKTIKVVCNRRQRCLPKKITGPKRASASLNPLAEEWVPKTPSTQKEWVPKTPLNPLAKTWVPNAHSSSQNSYALPNSPIPVPEKTQEQKEMDKKCASFNYKVNTFLLSLQELKIANIGQETKLITQCKYLRDMFNFIVESKEILDDKRYHLPSATSSGKRGFTQILAYKTIQISDEINAVYNKLRNCNRRANPTLRSIKIEALESIKRGQRILRL